MQTFLPYKDFDQSAECLDRQRLGKQRVECLQILRALNDPTYGWRNHPAVKMWKGYSDCLVSYGIAICLEWITRGYKDNCLIKIQEFRVDFSASTKIPDWLGDNNFHLSHQSNLLRKFPEHYSKHFDVPCDLEYVWPTER